MDRLSRHICAERRRGRPAQPRTAPHSPAAGVWAEEGAARSDGGRDFVSLASGCQACRGAQREGLSLSHLPFALPKPFGSVRPCSSVPPAQRPRDRREGPAGLSHAVFFPSPSLWTCVLFPTLPKIIAIQAWCVQAVSCHRGGGAGLTRGPAPLHITVRCALCRRPRGFPWGGGRRTLFGGICHESARSTGTAAGGYGSPGRPAVKSHTAQLWALGWVQAQGPTAARGAAEAVPGISRPSTSALHPAEEASRRMQIGRHELCRLLSTRLTQAKYYWS